MTVHERIAHIEHRGLQRRLYIRDAKLVTALLITAMLLTMILGG